MSLVDGSALLVYQGRAAAFAQVGGVAAGGGVPGDGDGLAGDLERDGALDGAAVRLRACPVPKSCFESSIATSMDQRPRIFR